MDYTLKYLDIWGVVTNEIIGDVLLTGLIFIAIIAAVGANFKMPGKLILFFISMFIIIFYTMYEGWHVFIYFGIVVFVGWILKKFYHK